MVVAGKLNRRLSPPDVFKRREMQRIQRSNRGRPPLQSPRQDRSVHFQQLDAIQQRARRTDVEAGRVLSVHPIPNFVFEQPA
jgi:hypothetical protein